MDVYELLRQEARSKKAGEPTKEQYTRVEIDLDTAREDEELHISGNQITMASCDGAATTTYFKLNHRHSRKLYPSEIEKVVGNFGGIYLTNVAETGKKLILYIGRDIFIFPSKAGANKILRTDGTPINPATSDNQDTIIANMYDVDSDIIMNKESFGGKPYSTPITSTNACQRFSSTNPEKLRDIIIKNTDASNPVDIGLYHATPATLRGASYELNGGAAIGFRNVDLYQLGLISSTDGNHAIVQVLGTEE